MTSHRSTTHTRDRILTALGMFTEPVTVTELADAVGMGRSTITKHLNNLEKEGAATRIPGGRDGRRRLPDHWTMVTTGAVLTPEAEAEGDQQATDTDPDAVDACEAPVTPTDPATAQAETPVSTSPQRPAVAPVTTHRLDGDEAGAVNPVSGMNRLAPGELKLMVQAILDSDPNQEFGATQISHLLRGRSIGAIQNNLARLVAEGSAELTRERPRRYLTTKALAPNAS
ncbi:MarR family transcriptional regulator [Nocardiopsis sp. EMB25]|uniref:ArsR/SmtB family transcription factor n=1 Tax=Nocardiopsis sp. EMB25 TaxID=2835867 RepID=UPI002283323D|nr:winged helix-turn-helix domain-containing protein [Nocardiopsis sp. EMB25]MCY9785226.1 MarR family transcriptional regulator [Nocardiopsis sp. EMB25]